MTGSVFTKFTGTKTVEACRMSRKAAEEVIGRKVRPDSDEIEDEEGYLVKYPDGYTSWSPSKAFEDAYRVSETHVDRMLIEKDEVEKRYLAGRKFTFSDAFPRLGDEQRRLLRRQLDIMENYLYTLTGRINIERRVEADKKGMENKCAYGKAQEPVGETPDGPLDGNGNPAEPLRSKHD